MCRSADSRGSNKKLFFMCIKQDESFGCIKKDRFKWRHNIQHDDIQHKDIQHKDIQHKDIQHDDIQHKNK